MTRALVLPVVLAACSPSGGEDPCPDAEPTLQAVYQQVFAPGCAFGTTCHTQLSARRSGNLVLGLVDESDPNRDQPFSPEVEAAILDGLLGEDRAGVPADNELAPGEVRVRPGDCAGSFLVRKMEGHDLADDGMRHNCPMPWRNGCEATDTPEHRCRTAHVCAWIDSLPAP